MTDLENPVDIPDPDPTPADSPGPAPHSFATILGWLITAALAAGAFAWAVWFTRLYLSRQP